MSEGIKSMGATSVEAQPRGRRIFQVIDLEGIRRDGGTQPRVAIDEATVEEYAGRMAHHDAAERAEVVDPEGIMFTPIVVFDDGEERWLADGFHRVAAAERAGLRWFQAELRRGSYREAVKFSLGANARHGKRRTNADKRRAVERALNDEEWALMSDSQLAETCCVSQPFVSKMRREMVSQGDIDPCAVRRGADGKLYRVANIGSRTARASQGHAETDHFVIYDTLRGATSPSSLGALVVRQLGRRDWYDVANDGIPLLGDCGVLIVPQTEDLCFAVSHLMREQIEYCGATVLPGPQIFQVWCRDRFSAVPSTSDSLEDLARSLTDANATLAEFSPVGH